MSEIVEEAVCLSVLAFRMQIYVNHRQSGMCGMLLMLDPSKPRRDQQLRLLWERMLSL